MNRKIFIRRSDIELLFDNPQPYEVTPIDKEPITEFYSMMEITEKYEVSETLVYNLVNAKNIPKLLCRGKNIYSKRHIDKHFSLKTPDPSITEWYSVDEIKEKYGMTTAAVYSFASDNVIPKKNIKGKTLYSKAHSDALLEQRVPDPTITEWYSMDEITEKYSLEQRYVSNLIYKNPIPKIRRGNKGYYSKAHFDSLMQEKFPTPEYYSVEEAMDKFGLTRDALYHYVKYHNIPKVKEGRYIKISKTHLDNIFEKRIIL